jgi:ABC-type antimicrobial peptide transport system permease subunit
MALIGIGLALGLLISLLMRPWIGRLLPLVPADELFSLSVAAVLFSIIGFLANLLPAMRATRLDPTLPMRKV